MLFNDGLLELTITVLLVDRLLDILAASGSSKGDVNRQSSTRSTAPMLSHDEEANKRPHEISEGASICSYEQE